MLKTFEGNLSFEGNSIFENNIIFYVFLASTQYTLHTSKRTGIDYIGFVLWFKNNKYCFNMDN